VNRILDSLGSFPAVSRRTAASSSDSSSYDAPLPTFLNFCQARSPSAVPRRDVVISFLFLR